jgi:hypothetical protein
MTADGGHLHLAVNMCWPYAYIKTAVEAGELDAQIDLASSSLRSGFKK